MKVETVKARIVKKFGSVNRFCNITGRNYQNLLNLFRQSDSEFKQSKLKELDELIKVTKVTRLAGTDLTEELVEKIRIAIVTEYKTYQNFCKKHKISNTWLSALMHMKPKLVSNRVKNLCNILNIEYE